MLLRSSVSVSQVDFAMQKLFGQDSCIHKSGTVHGLKALREMIVPYSNIHWSFVRCQNTIQDSLFVSVFDVCHVHDEITYLDAD